MGVRFLSEALRCAFTTMTRHRDEQHKRLMIWYTYIARCSDDSLYTGITPDLQKRERLHNNGKGAKSLLGKLPVKIIYFEKFANQILAARREREIKGWRRERKLNLIQGLP